MGAVNSGAIKKYFVMAGTVDADTEIFMTQ